MPDRPSRSNLIALTLGAVAVVVALAGLVARAPAPAPAPPPVAAAAAVHADAGETVVEFVLFGSSLDDVSLPGDAAPLLVYRVPAGLELDVTDVDATAVGLVLLRRAEQILVQVGFVVDRAAVGLGQSSRSYATGIRFGPGDELLVQPAGGDVEWAVLRGVLRPIVEPPVAGS